MTELTVTRPAPTAGPARRPLRTRALRGGVMALSVAGLLAGCAEGQGPSQRQGAGALLGAALGAAAGTLVGGNDRRNALVGAGVGLLAGAAVGTYLDRQEEALNEDLAGTGAEVNRVGDSLLVTLPEGVTFDTDSAEIKPRFSRALTQVAQTLNQYPESYVDIVGHTDDTGAEQYNQRLSEQRAQSVRRALVQRGVEPARLLAYGYGETQPVATNATPEGRAANRRVELLIQPAVENQG